MIKGFRGANNQSVTNAHIIGLFHRICKLLFFKIKPVFVFDGSIPFLKRQTIEERRSRRSKLLLKSRQSANKVLASYLSAQLDDDVDVAIEHSDAGMLLSSFLPRSAEDDDCKDIFFIPDDMPTENEDDVLARDEAEATYQQFIAAKLHEFQRLDDIDVNSDDFKQLTPEIRHEILTHLKERRSGWAKLNQLPKESTNFSSFQMSRLLHKQALQREIDNTVDELNADHGMIGGTSALTVASEASLRYSYQSKKCEWRLAYPFSNANSFVDLCKYSRFILRQAQVPQTRAFSASPTAEA